MLNVPTPPRVPPIHVPVLPKPPPRDPTSSSIYARQSPPPQSIRTSLSPIITSSTKHHLPGPLAIVRNIIATNGVKGLWLGHTGTVLRETGGTAVWFSVKEWVGRLLKERRTKTEHSSSSLLPWESAFAGAISGAVCVAALYPADTVKSAMQTEEELREMRVYQQRASSAAREWSTSPPSTTLTPTSSTSSASYSTSKQPLTASSVLSSALKRSSRASPESMSFLGTFLKIYRTHGAKGLYSGCGMSMARAVPSSGIVFVVYDGLRAWFA
jgi:ornithine carrier protein